MNHYPVKKLKPKRCKLKSCGEWFTPSPYRPLQLVCNPMCGVGYAKQLTEEKEKRAHRKWKKESKEKLKTRTDHLNELQDIVNRFIRVRDKNLPCISCERPKTVQFHAGHFYPVGRYPELRFNEDNIHKQCSRCNDELSGNIHEYRPRLINKIGQERFDALEQAKNKPLKLTLPEILELKKVYREKIRELIKEHGV